MNYKNCGCGDNCEKIKMELGEIIDSLPIDQLKLMMAECVTYNLESFLKLNRLSKTNPELATGISPVITYVTCILQILKPILEKEAHLKILVQHLNKSEAEWMQQHNIKQGES